MKRFLQLTFFCLLLTGCDFSVPVVVDGKDRSGGSITIDGDEHYNFKDSAIVLRLSPGLHKVSLDGEKPREFYVGREGGLLNLDSQAYIAYQVKYMEQGNEGKRDMYDLSAKAVVLIDSFIVMEGNMSVAPPPDSFLVPYAEELLRTKNGNYYPMANIRPGFESDYDSNASVYGLKRFGKGQLFVDRFWDYELDGDIPERVLVPGKSGGMFPASSKKIAIFREYEFLMIAAGLPEQFIVKSTAGLKLKGK